ncbi:MAG TPA: hypothetical protein VKB88_14280 [Bryobacteraceae bacterium]|nr:hypothetical protein [Bryobacteraceae bacterium]
MKHYEIVQWVDFARGLVTRDEELRMRDHLSAGCVDCRHLFKFCRSVCETSRNLPAPVPDWVVRGAKSVAPIRTAPKTRRFSLIPVDLIYDSFLAPAPAGLRSSWQVGWQGLYHAADCSLDLRIEPELKSSRAAVIGQITNRTAPRMEMDNIPVCLKLGKKVIAETVSNRFGEFQMEYEQQGRLQLCVYLEGGTKRIQVPLRKLAADYPLGGDRLKLENKKRMSNRT